jgi:hypothetical protein
MLQVQRKIINLPGIIENGRYLILEERVVLLNKFTYTHMKDITCFLFNDLLILTYRIRKHFPYLK